MKDITPEMVQHFASASTVGPKTTANICITLQSLWRTAKAWGYVNQNVFDGVVLPAAKRVRRFFLSEREIHRIISAASEPYKTFYGLLAETGLRVGELCGLTVEDINLERNILQVRQSAWRGKLGDPKTNESIRVVEVSHGPLSMSGDTCRRGTRTSNGSFLLHGQGRRGTRIFCSSGSFGHFSSSLESEFPRETGSTLSVTLTQR